MDLANNVEHNFDLRGLPERKSFFGCKRCWHMEVDSFCPHCPKCSKPGMPVAMGFFIVTKEDVEKFK